MKINSRKIIEGSIQSSLKKFILPEGILLSNKKKALSGDWTPLKSNPAQLPMITCLLASIVLGLAGLAGKAHHLKLVRLEGGVEVTLK